MIGNVSDWLSYAGGALLKVTDSAGSTVVFPLCKFYKKTSAFPLPKIVDEGIQIK